MIAAGDRVRLMRMPPLVETWPDEYNDMHTREIFQQCVGNVFTVRGIDTNNPHGETDHIELWVHCGINSDLGNADSIWVEQKYVEIVI